MGREESLNACRRVTLKETPPSHRHPHQDTQTVCGRTSGAKLADLSDWSEGFDQVRPMCLYCKARVETRDKGTEDDPCQKVKDDFVISAFVF